MKFCRLTWEINRMRTLSLQMYVANFRSIDTVPFKLTCPHPILLWAAGGGGRQGTESGWFRHETIIFHELSNVINVAIVINPKHISAINSMMTSSNGNIFRVAGPSWGNSPITVEFPSKWPVTRSLMFSLLCIWTKGWAKTPEAGNLGRCRAHYDITVMSTKIIEDEYAALFPVRRPRKDFHVILMAQDSLGIDIAIDGFTRILTWYLRMRLVGNIQVKMSF